MFTEETEKRALVLLLQRSLMIVARFEHVWVNWVVIYA